MKKFALISALAGAAMFIASNASAVMGTIAVSGTAELQSFTTNKSGDTILVGLKRSVSQKDLLFILAEATGDTNITSKPTKIYYDPDAINTNLTIWVNNNETITNNIYGIFYYSNSASGRVPLDGTNDAGYYSYMEFDYNSPNGQIEGFWNPGGMEANSVVNINSALTSVSETGNAILYVHDNPLAFDLLGFWNLVHSNPLGTPSKFYFANNTVDGFAQNYAMVFHGAIAFKLSSSVSKGTNIVSESFTLKGSGDMNYNQTNGTISGTATFSGKGPVSP